MSKKKQTDRTDGFVLGISLLLFVALVAYLISSREYWPRYDSGAYISAGLALHQGLGLRDITAPVSKPMQAWTKIPEWVQNDPELKEKADWPHFVQYPPLLPLLLVPLLTYGQGEYLFLQALPIASTFIALLIFGYWGKELFPTLASSGESHIDGGFRISHAVLLATSCSLVTLFAIRVQSEALHLLGFAVVCLGVSRLFNEEYSWLRSYLLVSLALFLSLAIHTKAIFFAFGFATGLLFVKRVPRTLRILLALLVFIGTVGATLYWMKVGTWGGVNAFSAQSPYFRQDGWNNESENVFGSNVIPLLAERIWLGAQLSLFSTGLLSETAARSLATPVLTALSFFLLLPLGLCVWVRRGNWLLAWMFLCHLAGCILSPWMEPRMMVPVEPLFLYALLLGVTSVAQRIRLFAPQAYRLVSVVSVLCVCTLFLVYWAQQTPGNDLWAKEAHLVEQYAAQQADRRFPLDAVFYFPGDNFSFALSSGRTTLSSAPHERKSVDFRIYQSNKGSGVQIELARFRKAIPEGVLRESRIHPRWFEIRESDRERLWKHAFNDEK